MKKVVISWGRCIRRSSSIALYLGAKDLVFDATGKTKLGKLIGYLKNALRTFMYLYKNKPSQVVVVAPPILTVYCAYIYYKLSKGRIKVIYDFHNGVLRNEWANWPFIKGILKSNGDVISHNKFVKKKIDSTFNIQSKVLSDPIINFDSKRTKSSFLQRDKFNVFIPLSYADDEPVSEIIEAAKLLGDKYNLILSGNFNKKFTAKQAKSLAVTFTGFILEDEYITLLREANLILCLTNEKDIQMCAVVEAISIGTAFICSNNPVNTEYFSSFYFKAIENTASSIANAIKKANQVGLDHNHSIDELRYKYQQQWIMEANEIF